MNRRDVITKTVLDFYTNLPFNYPSSPHIAANEIIKHNTLPNYFKEMESIFTEDKSVLELGCGIGWMSNMINYYHKCEVLGIDINPMVIEYANEIKREIGSQANFKVLDLFDFNERLFDIVVSIGVLHNTYDCIEGVKHICNLTKKSGYCIIGLYNAFGRKPFLEYFESLKAKNYTEEQLFSEYRKLDNRHSDETMSRSWFYDQVLHPQESLHTLSEINDVFTSNRVKLIGVSFSDYAKISDMDELYKLEILEYDKAITYLEEGKFYSGFFIVIGEKF